jgi:hypothetical protein
MHFPMLEIALLVVTCTDIFYLGCLTGLIYYYCAKIILLYCNLWLPFPASQITEQKEHFLHY